VNTGHRDRQALLLTRHRASTNIFSLTFRVRVTTPRSMDEMEQRTQQARRFYRRRGESSPVCVVRGTACGGGVRWAWRITVGLYHTFPWCCHINATSAPIANPPNSAQLGGISYQSLQATSGSVQYCEHVAADRQTDTRIHRHTHRRA